MLNKNFWDETRGKKVFRILLYFLFRKLDRRCDSNAFGLPTQMGVSQEELFFCICPWEQGLLGAPGYLVLMNPEGWHSTDTEPVSSLESSTLRRVLSLTTARLMASLFMACHQGVNADAQIHKSQCGVCIV